MSVFFLLIHGVEGYVQSADCVLYVYAGRVHADGRSDTTAPRASDRRSTAGRQLGRDDDVVVADVIAVGGDVTTSAAARRRQARRRRTGYVAAPANRRTPLPFPCRFPVTLNRWL